MSVLNIMLSRQKVESERGEVERKLKGQTYRRSSSSSSGDSVFNSETSRRGSDSIFRSRRSSSISTVPSTSTG